MSHNKKTTKIVYLAGGFKSGWQDIVMQKAPCAKFLDPRHHGLSAPRDYTSWDLAAVKKSDLVFACLEKNNPGGYALALELGYAKALNKKIIFVDATDRNQPRKQYLHMLYSVASINCSTLAGGIRVLLDLSR